MWSNTSAVLVLPCLLKHLSIILPNAFLSTKKSISNPNGSSFLSTNPKSWGIFSLNMNLPTVLSVIPTLPSSKTILIFTVECNSTALVW